MSRAKHWWPCPRGLGSIPWQWTSFCYCRCFVLLFYPHILPFSLFFLPLWMGKILTFKMLTSNKCVYSALKAPASQVISLCESLNLPTQPYKTLTHKNYMESKHKPTHTYAHTHTHTHNTHTHTHTRVNITRFSLSLSLSISLSLSTWGTSQMTDLGSPWHISSTSQTIS